MIEPMIRYNFLLYHADVNEFMDQLQDLGMVDITASDWQATEEQRELISLADRYKTAYQHLGSVDTDQAREAVEAGRLEPYENPREAVVAYEEAKERLEDLDALRSKAVTELDALEAWGEFDPKLIRRLRAEEGINLRFFEVPTKQYKKEWESDYPIEVVKQVEGAGETYFVVAETREMAEAGEPLQINAVEHKAPTMTYQQKEAQIEGYLQDEKAEEEKMARAALSREGIWSDYLGMKDEISFDQAVNSGEVFADGTIKIVEGFSVVQDREKVEQFAEQFADEGVIYTAEKGRVEQNPPIKLKNKFFPKLFEVIGSLYMTPRYNEIDLTPFFAPFYMIFFGMCLGDAGYGMIFILATILLWKKIPVKYKKVGWLVIFLGIATVFWGLLTGNIFGIELIKVPTLVAFKDYFVTTDMMFNVALGLGAVQILFGQTIKIFNKMKQGGSYKYGLSQIGWVILLFTGTFAFLEMVKIDSVLFYVLVGISALLILFFNSPGKNPLVNFGAGLYDCYSMATGLVGDLMSYIRLFALALSGSIIAQVFNELAKGLSPDVPVIGFLIMVIILLIGHGITIFISTLGAFVHPVRLTFVEFYKNAGFEGGGRDFAPLKRMKIENQQ